MREDLRTKDNNDFIQTVAQNRTTPDLLASALELAKQGVVTLSEVMRIVGEQI
jgi:type II secretory ATPase GspE/PulE/Tfp pilus assembly ATPase PilB-like protein